MEQPEPPRLNNFSVLRILFAVLVIASHSSEIIYGNRSHEILTSLFGTISFGVFAVDGFFIVSGYLVTQSYQSSGTLAYLYKRILRIYPAYIVAFFASMALCQYLSVYPPHLLRIISWPNFHRAFLLKMPYVAGAYPGSFYPQPNGAMWTISYEFHCYILIIVLGAVGVFRNRWMLLAGTAICVAAYLFHPDKYMAATISGHAPAMISHPKKPSGLLADIKSLTLESPIKSLRFFSLFLSGSCFYTFRDRIIFQGAYVAIAATALFGCLFAIHLAEPALAVFGSYLIFWFAFDVPPLPISNALNKTDLSYGIYLYAWPVEKALIFLAHTITPVEVFTLTTIISALLAYLSWTIIEKPFLKLKSVAWPRLLRAR